MVISVKTYEQVALEDEDELWELECGVLRRKPGMTARHNEIMTYLAAMLISQLDRNEYAIRSDSARLRVSDSVVYVPDVAVIPRALERQFEEHRPTALENYADAVPLVVEVWSPSTGGYDVEVKLKGYQQRLDAEIWRLHPHDKTLTAWRLQPDGSYAESLHTEGTIVPIALSAVRIEIPALFE